MVLNGQRATDMLLDRIGSRLSGLSGGPMAADAARPAAFQIAQAGTSAAALAALAPALPPLMTEYGGWFRGVGFFDSLNGNNVAPGFTTQSGGFFAGFDRPLLPGFIAGLAGGYLHSDVHEHSTSNGDLDTVRIAGYLGTAYGPAFLTATAGYAHDWISTSRGFPGLGTAREPHDGDEATAAAQIAVPTAVPTALGPVTVTPRAGVQFLHLSESGFAETGASGFDLSSMGRSTDSLQPFIRVAATQILRTPDGTEIAPEIRFGYSREVLSNNHAWNVLALDGTPFLALGVKPSRDMVSAGVAATARAASNLYFFASYDAILHTGNTTAHTVSAGLRLRF